MADRPLRPATHRGLGEPLPHQLANGPRAPPNAEAEASFTRADLGRQSTSGISPSFLGLSQSSGQVTHVLLTRSRLCPRPKPGSSLHLHVLGTPPAFVLSQDQTLRKKSTEGFNPIPESREPVPLSQRAVMPQLAPRTQGGARMTDYFGPPSARTRRRRVGLERESGPEPRTRVALLSFQGPHHARPKGLLEQARTASEGDQPVYLPAQGPCLIAAGKEP